ncbi:hypothetical protein O181_082451 [Austropuccinia psidii MF-1]|uniref:Uncharacterized protein n=1 Tax=Austropuccinia psidii MF-1 TaxID=1389203 RepID=A0A9Q3FSM0_9BASI|nr:hypothetical protein [Austropuccinia psidii MF-1]
MIGSPGDIKDSLIAEIIVGRSNENYVNTGEISQNQFPLTISKVIDYLEQRFEYAVDYNENTIKKETVFDTRGNSFKNKLKRTDSKFTNGKHNPKTEHSDSECRELKKDLSQKGRTKNVMKDYDEESIENSSPSVHAEFQGNNFIQEIIVDYVFSHHMTPDIYYFNQYKYL